MQTSFHSVKQALLPVIQHYFAPCTAYWLGDSTHALGSIASSSPTLSLVVVVFSESAPPDAARQAADALAQKDLGFRVLFLLHRTTDLGTKNPEMQRFFYAVLQSGSRLCLNTARVPYCPFDELPQRNRDNLQTYWLKCQAVADYYLEAAGSARLEVERIKIAMLHQAVEQICLGLIRLYSGYAPNTFELRFLLELCEHYTALPAECFPRQGEANWRRFKSLCAPPSMLRHWVHLDAPEADFLILYQNTCEFQKKAAHLADAQLKEIFANQSKQ